MILVKVVCADHGNLLLSIEHDPPADAETVEFRRCPKDIRPALLADPENDAKGIMGSASAEDVRREIAIARACGKTSYMQVRVVDHL